MGVYEGRGQLARAMKDLNNRWLDTKSTWTDATSEAFEKEHLVSLENDLRHAFTAMEHMGQILSIVKRDCGG